MKTKKEKVIAFGARYNAAAERAQNVIGARIAAARKARGWSLSVLRDRLSEFGVDLTNSSVSKWETGETVPNVYQFLAVCSALEMEGGLDSFRQNDTPLLNEEGLRRLAEYKFDLICSGNYRPVPKEAPVPRVSYIDMPVAVMPAAAGTGNLLDDREYYEMVSFRADQVKPHADVGIRVSGDSMEPHIHDGDIVWVQKCQTLHVGEVGVFLYGGKAFIKVYREQDPDPAFLDEFTDSYGSVRSQPVLVSCNTAYPPIPVSPYAPFSVFGRVLM